VDTRKEKDFGSKKATPVFKTGKKNWGNSNYRGKEQRGDPCKGSPEDEITQWSLVQRTHCKRKKGVPPIYKKGGDAQRSSEVSKQRVRAEVMKLK